MPSPFPGMDPYLERHWRDIHQDLAALARRNLNRILPGDLIARLEERLVVDSVAYAHPRAIYPDVRVYQDESLASGGSLVVATAEVAEPVILECGVEEFTEPFIVITDQDGGTLITAIEFLSPSNKIAGPGRDQYRQKRGELLSAGANLVEIDLVRQGSWRELLLPAVAPGRIDSAYRATCRQPVKAERVILYQLPLRQKLKAIPIPLRPTDKDVLLDLQPLMNEVYINGKYEATNYGRPCEPPLEGEDGVWAEVLLKAAGKK